MKKKYLIISSVALIAIVVIVVTVLLVNKFSIFNVMTDNKQLPIGNEDLMLTSTVFKNNEFIPKEFTCKGLNVNPPLDIVNKLEGVKSLALVVDDPDAPAGDWTHWVVWNIKPSTTSIAKNSLPDGATQGVTDFGKTKYGGPCPPSGIHHYHFRLFALDTALDIASTSKKADLYGALKGHIIGSTELIGKFSAQ